MNRLLIRADGGPSIGAGHLMRCLALGQAWQDLGGSVQFVTAGEMPQFRERLAADHFIPAPMPATAGSTDDALATLALARETRAVWIVVDGYRFNGTYQDTLREAGQRVLFIDDCGHGDHYSADLILNQNLHADESLYARRSPESRLLLGARYTLLRREFRCRPERSRQTPSLAQRILVTLGGSDPDNTTTRVIEAFKLLRLPGLEARIVIGPANPHAEAVAQAVRDLPFPVRVERDPASLAELMAWADLAVSAAGSTSWELAFMGLPQLALAIAPNQAPIAAALARYGLAESVGDAWTISPFELAHRLESILANAALRSRLAGRGPQIVDGQGAMRVAKLLREGSEQ